MVTILTELLSLNLLVLLNGGGESRTLCGREVADSPSDVFETKLVLERIVGDGEGQISSGEAISTGSWWTISMWSTWCASGWKDGTREPEPRAHGAPGLPGLGR